MTKITWGKAVLRYKGRVIDWKSDDLKVIDRKTRSIMTFYGAWCPKTDVDKQYLPRSKEGRKLIGFEIYIKSEENKLAWYRTNCVEKLMMELRQAKILNCDHLKQKKEYKQEK